MIDEADWSRLARFFAGECSAEEATALREWLGADERRMREATRLRALWMASATPEWAADTNAAWQRVSARMGVAEGLSAVALYESRPSAPRHHFRRLAPETRWWRAGLVALPAALLLLAVLVPRRAAILALLDPPSPQEPVQADREYRTARGQRAVVVLGDGSRVELGTESVLRVQPFRDSTRVVWLEGQAVFEVVHDSAHAFHVHAKNAVTEDLGTRFAIRAYPTDTRVQVIVTSGKVALRASGAPAGSGTLLGPADLGVLDSAGQTTVRNGVDSLSYLAWTRDRFVFDNAPLSDVLPEIARWFDAQITIGDSAALRRRITMNVPANSLRSVLGAATLPLGLHFSIDGRTVVIR